MAIEESLDGNQDFRKTDLSEKAKEKEEEEKRKKKKKNNNFIPAVTSITSVLVPSGALASLGRSKQKLPHAKYKSYPKVARITNNFQCVIGRGGSGSVYLGILSDGTGVAVKVISPLYVEGLRAFQTEAELVTRLHHKNLVLLHGYFCEGSFLALMFEYMIKGSLKGHLSDEKEDVLSWKQRIGIAIDVAKGLEYLHDGCMPPIIHRDVKSGNILLSEKLQAKVTDFGLSRVLYLDPEYILTSRLSVKSDVYGFGVVLLELISGKPVIIVSNEGSVSLIQWVQALIDRGNIMDIVVPRLTGYLDVNSVQKVVEVAMTCVKLSPIERPSMSFVASELKECLRCLEIITGDVNTMEDAIVPQGSFIDWVGGCK